MTYDNHGDPDPFCQVSNFLGFFVAIDRYVCGHWDKRSVNLLKEFYKRLCFQHKKRAIQEDTLSPPCSFCLTFGALGCSHPSLTMRQQAKTYSKSVRNQHVKDSKIQIPGNTTESSEQSWTFPPAFLLTINILKFKVLLVRTLNCFPN